MVYQLGYVSTAVGGVERRQLLQILSDARSRNSAAEVTGVLLYREGRFLQLLEGPALVVGSLFRRIESDPRHVDVRCIWTAHGAGRLFEEWSMGFRDLTDDPLQHPGYVNLLDSSDVVGPSSSALIALWELLQPTPSRLDEPGGQSAATVEHRLAQPGSALLGVVAALRRTLEQVR